jgi:hypothetical protein
MGVFKIFPSKDSTIYSIYPNLNAGLDEIVELSLQNNELISTGNNTIIRPEASRTIIQFPSESILDVVNNKISGSQWRAYLKLFLAKANAIPSDFKIQCFAVSESWDMGTGRYSDIPQTQNGVSWNSRTTTGVLWKTGSFTSGTTGSFSGSRTGGGNWFTASMASQSFNYVVTKDIELDVTNIVNLFYSGTIQNNGFILKQEIEFLTSSIFDFKFFSMDTHTIYPPQLEFRWSDASFITGSASVASSDKILLTLNENKGEYQQGSIQRFRINVRDRYPVRAFQTSSVYLNTKLLPSRSYWALKDLHTDEFVIGFDTGSTVISADGTSSYFDLYTDGLEPERNYKFLFKTLIGSQAIIHDDNYYFKVVK